jgi:regulatory protein
MRGRAPASKASDPAAVEIAAVRLLTRREHSTDELIRKLVAKGYDKEVVARVVGKLTTKRLVSDQRFASDVVQHRARRGQGPVRIRAELRQQGVPEETIDRELEAAGVDWRAVAQDVRRRKFGAAPPRTRVERAKQARFLQYRGFSADQIRAALGGGPDEPEAMDDEPNHDWPE